MEDFFQLVRDLLTVLFCAENEILSEEGLDAMDSFRNEPGWPPQEDEPGLEMDPSRN